MRTKTYIAGAIALALFGMVPVGSSDEPIPEIDPIAEVLCSQAPEEVRDVFHSRPDPQPGFPDMILTTHVICFADLEIPVDTDCTATNYSFTGWKWNTAYSGRVATSNPDGLSSSGILSAFNAGGNAWDNIVSQDIFGSFVSGGSASAIPVYDSYNQHGFKYGGSYVAATWTWSSGGVAVQSDAAYNTYYDWSLSGASGKMDVQNVQTHEVGHTFGMGHTTTASANACLTMYPYVNYGETRKRSLGDGDILGIDARY